MPSPRVTASWVGLSLVVAGISIPMMLGLREPELRSDESIYSYAAQRMLETGDWVTPRAIPDDGPFIEKPPLNMWISAAAIKLGLPNDELGLRFFDGVFGAIAFVYIFLIGQRLGGPACGVVAGITLFAMHLLSFDHGLRSNNMEAPLFLCYCGGMFHFARWAESPPGRGARGHAIAVAAFFTLGFMTKDVAAIFLPIVGVLALAWRPERDGWRIVKTRVTEWLLPVALVLVSSAPWFIYESWKFGEQFWTVILGVHVYQRFTSSLDPGHLHPWWFYSQITWEAIRGAGACLIVTAGAARLIYLAWRDRVWLARLTLIWGVVPLVLISIGTSKLPHYAYPFWPPIGLAAGAAFAWAVRRLDDLASRWAERVLGRRLPTRVLAWSRHWAAARPIMLVAAIGLAVLSVVTMIHGPLALEWRGTVWLRNSSTLRPLIFAALLAGIAGQARNLIRGLGSLVLALLLPIGEYAKGIEVIGRVDHPIRTTRDCVAEVQQSGAGVAPGVLAASGDVFHHGYYFYLRHLGPWTRTEQFSEEQTLERLTAPGRQTPVLIARPDYDAIVPKLPAAPAGLRYDQNIAVILPGPFAPCAARILKDGGWPLWDRPAR